MTEGGEELHFDPSAPPPRYLFSGLESGDNEIAVDFEFVNPKEDFFKVLANAFLVTYLHGTSLDTSAMADAIVEQVSIGTFIVNGTEEGQQHEK